MATKTKRIKYTVKGGRPFPIDMLRYDQSWPESETDARVIEACLDYAQPGQHRTVTLLTDSPQPPNVDRWRSFGWDVVEAARV